jgi:hypothetical protein
LDRTFYPESDLDIYSHPGHVYEVLEWIESFGYQFAPHRYQEEDWRTQVSPDWDGTMPRIVPRLMQEDENDIARLARYSNISEVYTFKRFVVMDGEHVELQVQVIETTYNPIDTIMKYHSSASKLFPFFQMSFDAHGFSLCYEYHYLRCGIFILPNRNIRGPMRTQNPWIEAPPRCPCKVYQARLESIFSVQARGRRTTL